MQNKVIWNYFKSQKHCAIRGLEMAFFCPKKFPIYFSSLQRNEIVLHEEKLSIVMCKQILDCKILVGQRTNKY